MARRGTTGMVARWLCCGLVCCLLDVLSVACTPSTPPSRDAGSASRPSRPQPAAPRTPSASAHPSRRAAPRGTRAWRLTRPARDGQVQGYLDRTSGPAGTRVRLFVCTRARTYRATAYRIGAYLGGGTVVWRSGRRRGGPQAGPAFADVGRRTVVARWRRPVGIDTTGWRPGLYVVKLVDARGWQSQVPYVVSSPSARGRTALVFPVTTWQAYNDWGGYSLYEAPPGDRRSWAVGFDRPYAGAGTVEVGFSAAPVALTAERLGIPLAYFTNVDLDRDPDLLRGASTYVSVGHDEYWSDRMRQAVVTARDTGTNLVFLGANTMYWRVRLEHHGRVVVGYKTDAALDPVAPSRRTGRWRDVADPENEVTGEEYECFPVDAPFRVASPRWWGFAGTGTHRGETFQHLVGVEADRVYPVPGTPRPMQVLSHVRYSCRGVTTSAQASYYTTRSGAAVLDVGTLRWTCALVDRCPSDLTPRTVRFVDRVTATVLRDFARGPAGGRHPAHDNLDAFHLSPVNEVPAS